MATNRIERVLRHDGIVAVLDMTGDASSAPAPMPAAAPAPAPSTGFGAPAPAVTPSAVPAPVPTPSTGFGAPVPAAAPVATNPHPVGSPAPQASPPSQSPQGTQVSWVGDENWRAIVMEAVKLRQIANEPSVRVEVGDHKVMVSGDDKHVIGVVFIKGHPVVKSVVRMVRQLLRQPSSSSSGL